MVLESVVLRYSGDRFLVLLPGCFRQYKAARPQIFQQRLDSAQASESLAEDGLRILIEFHVPMVFFAKFEGQIRSQFIKHCRNTLLQAVISARGYILSNIRQIYSRKIRVEIVLQEKHALVVAFHNNQQRRPRQESDAVQILGFTYFAVEGAGAKTAVKIANS